MNNGLFVIMIALSSGLAGCWASDHFPEPGTPNLPPSAQAASVSNDSPPGATELGHVYADGSLFGTEAGCREAMAAEAARLGGDYVRADMKWSAWGMYPKCSGTVFKRGAAVSTTSAATPR